MARRDRPRHAGRPRARMVGKPEWCPWFDKAEYAIFAAAVEAAARRHGAGDDGLATMSRGFVTLPASAGECTQRGLVNIAATCGQAPMSAWTGLVDRHFASIAAAEEQLAERMNCSLEDARPRLRSRILSADAADADWYVSRHLADDLVEALNLRWPESVTNVSPRDVERWDADVDALFALGRENLAAGPPPKRREIRLRDGRRVLEFSGDSSLTASRLLHLELLLDLPTYGALVVVPNRHLLAVAPIEAAEDLLSAGELLTFARDHVDGPGPLTDSLYWWSGPGSLVRCPAAVQGRELDVTLPEQLRSLPSRGRLST